MVAKDPDDGAVAGLFTPGGTHALKGEFAGVNDFEVATWVVIVEDSRGATPIMP